MGNLEATEHVVSSPIEKVESDQSVDTLFARIEG